MQSPMLACAVHSALRGGNLRIGVIGKTLPLRREWGGGSAREARAPLADATWQNIQARGVPRGANN